MRVPGASQQLTGKRLWRSLDELASTDSFKQMLHREFPHAASEWKDADSRRHFLKLMGASLALAGLSACTLRKTEEKIVPYVNPPEEVIPGRPLFFASSMPWAGYGKGVVVESHEGRPTKIEGNPDHPASLGTSDIWMQASVLDMYDPDRSQVVMHGETVSSWSDFIANTAEDFDKQKTTRGSGLRFLTGASTSPTAIRQMKAILKQMPNAKWHTYEVVGRRNARAGAIQAFGQDVETLYRFDKADVVLALDSNFLLEHPGSLIYARQFIDRRRLRGEKKSARPFAEAKLNRLYVAETSVSATGAQADHRWAIKSSEIEPLAREIAAVIAGGSASGPMASWATAIAKDLLANSGKSLVVVGESQPASLHALGHAINEKLGNVGKTINYIDPVEGGDGSSLEELVKDINSDLVDLLVIIGTNPSFTAPRELGLMAGLDDQESPDARFGDYKKDNPLSKVALVVHHGIYGKPHDETATFAHWHIPASHYLESWGDVRAFEGTASIIQPLIYPLYATKTEIELLSHIAGEGDISPYDLVKQTWSKLSDDDWQRALEKGVIPQTAFDIKQVSLKLDLADVMKSAPSTQPTTQPAGNGLELVFKPDPSLYDGRYANNGWLQEVPKPITLLTWDNVAMVSVATAQRLQIDQGDKGRGLNVPLLNITCEGRRLEIPAMIMPGQADDSITVYLGFGRKRCGRVGNGIGSDSYALRPSSDQWFVSDTNVDVIADSNYLVATAQSHHLMEIPGHGKGQLDDYWTDGRELVQNFTIAQVKSAPQSPKQLDRRISLPIHKENEHPDETLLPAWNYDFNKWGMVIDNQACIGCNACVVACQSENNIAVVGKEQVLKGREMHWIRIDTYFIGEQAAAPEVYLQPIPCMQCENAPCELVCPVEATTTSAEGINEQTYNRCVGTRYCSNNCPYKVRRFNFLYYTDYDAPQLQLQRNPNVTVRSRGIMEKCNYCIQRINNGRIEAKKQDRPINPGDVVTACEQACPTKAIFFGNLNDKRWDVTTLQEEPLRFTLLDELNALPRTSYLARVRNPNPDLPGPVKV